MKFNSQICTTKEQSERLLALGLKKETADMTLQTSLDVCFTMSFQDAIEYFEDRHLPPHPTILPAWSLHRLIEMLNYQVIHNGKKYEPVIAIDGMAYQDVCNDGPIVGWSRDLYTDVIDCIEWLISIEQFNKEYLEE